MCQIFFIKFLISVFQIQGIELTQLNLKFFMFCAVRQVTIHIPTTALKLDTVIY